jgi:hypothetical protein
MKNKPAPALLRPSNLSNEIKKRVPKSRETIPLKLTRGWGGGGKGIKKTCLALSQLKVGQNLVIIIVFEPLRSKTTCKEHTNCTKNA